MIDAATVRAHLDYAPATGEFRRRTGSRRWIGRVAGCIDIQSGYVVISINGKQHYAHRLAWMHVTGELPPAEIDHANHTRSDNRWANLRLATRAENGCNLSLKRNNTSGTTGVSFDVKREKWASYINPARRKISLGYFANKADAIAARKAAEKKYFSAFATQ